MAYRKKKISSPDLNVLDRKWKVMLKAKEHISDELLLIDMERSTHKYEFICHAVSWVVNKNVYNFEGIAEYIRDDIANMLYPTNNLSEWLCHIKGMPPAVVFSNNQRKLQTTRKAWVD